MSVYAVWALCGCGVFLAICTLITLDRGFAEVFDLRNFAIVTALAIFTPIGFLFLIAIMLEHFGGDGER